MSSVYSYTYGRNPFKKDHTTLWSNAPLAFKVTHAGGSFILTSETRIDYKETIELLKKQGYERPFITYIGRDVSM